MIQCSIYVQKLSFSTLQSATARFVCFGTQTEIFNAISASEH